MNDLPADLQKVYDSLHLTEEQFEVLDEFLGKALKAIENEPKYEKALFLMAGADVGRPCRNCIYSINGKHCYHKDYPLGPLRCVPGTVDYYKSAAGFKNTDKWTVPVIKPEVLEKLTGQKWGRE